MVWQTRSELCGSMQMFWQIRCAVSFDNPHRNNDNLCHCIMKVTVWQLPCKGALLPLVRQMLHLSTAQHRDRLNRSASKFSRVCWATANMLSILLNDNSCCTLQHGALYMQEHSGNHRLHAGSQLALHAACSLPCQQWLNLLLWIAGFPW